MRGAAVAQGGNRAEGADHEVDRDDVDHALGHAGELLEQAPGIGDEDGLGHAGAADPARAGLDHDDSMMEASARC